MIRREVVDIQPVPRSTYMRPEFSDELESLASGRPSRVGPSSPAIEQRSLSQSKGAPSLPKDTIR